MCAVISGLNSGGMEDVCEACAWHARRLRSSRMARETYTKLVDGTADVYERSGRHGDLYEDSTWHGKRAYRWQG